MSVVPGVAERRVGRYLLEDLVAERGGTSLWRATDPALQRPVGARLMPLSDSRADGLRVAALAAARVDDRRLVKVLDVVETEDNLAIITEWVTGQSWSELLTERWSSQETMVVAVEMSRALESAHEAGVAHGRIRPDSVMVTDTGEVRLRGLGVEAAIWGIDPAGDPFEADIHGLGSLLYAGMTLRWPTERRVRSIGGLRTIGPIGSAVPAPSALVADVPRVVDDICGRSIGTSGGSRSEGPYTDVSEFVRDLERALADVPALKPADNDLVENDIRTDRIVGRLSTLAVFVFALVGLGLLSWQLFVNLANEHEAVAPRNSADSVGVPQIPAFETPLPESAYTIASARDFDPDGDGQENPDLASQAIDRSPKTAWVTSNYPTASLSPKAGVGLILDLGTTRPFRAMNLKLYGTGSDFQIMVARKKWRDLSDFRPVANITGSGDSIRIRMPKQIRARYVLVWFTGLPYAGNDYVGGLRDVEIVG